MKRLLARAEAIQSLLSSGDCSDQREDVLRAAVQCAGQLIEHGEFGRAMSVLERLQGATDKGTAPIHSLQSGTMMLWALLRLERIQEAHDLAQQLLECWASATASDPESWALLRSLEASCYWRSNRAAEAIAKLQPLRAELLLRPDSFASCSCALELLAAYELAGDRSAARELCREGVGLLALEWGKDADVFTAPAVDDGQGGDHDDSADRRNSRELPMGEIPAHQ